MLVAISACAHNQKSRDQRSPQTLMDDRASFVRNSRKSEFPTKLKSYLIPSTFVNYDQSYIEIVANNRDQLFFLGTEDDLVLATSGDGLSQLESHWNQKSCPEFLLVKNYLPLTQELYQFVRYPLIPNDSPAEEMASSNRVVCKYQIPEDSVKIAHHELRLTPDHWVPISSVELSLYFHK